MKKLALFAALAAVTTSASAVDFIDDFDTEKTYVGGGLGLYSPDASGYDNAIGFQVLAGYELDFTIADDIETAVEVGYSSATYEWSSSGNYFGTTYSNSGEVDVAGLWIAGLASYPVADQIKVTAQLGYDLGDDDGLLFGLGGGYEINDEFTVRADYVMRANTSAMVANAIYKF